MARYITPLLIGLALCFSIGLDAQDTFSIVAVDSATGEVGSAGASCVDLYQFSLPNDDFLSVLVPGVGAINTQASYDPTNQNNATNQMNQGKTPDQIIQWLVANDVSNMPNQRQYGIVTLNNGSPLAAAHTGSSNLDYKGDITGTYYSIQGNILLGPEVLDSMEAYFLREDGDLACKLMAALQGAKMVGADTRCAANGTSSLFAFVKVAKPTDPSGQPSFLASVRTRANAGIEPIDSLQTIFESVHSCPSDPTSINEVESFQHFFDVYPSPAQNYLQVNAKDANLQNMLYVYDLKGQLLLKQIFESQTLLDIVLLEKGAYRIKITNQEGVFNSSFVKR